MSIEWCYRYPYAGKSGIDLLKEVQELYPDVKTVVLSGYSDFDYAKDAIRYGAVEYLTKPVNLGEVEELLGAAVRKIWNAIKKEAKNSYISHGRPAFIHCKRLCRSRYGEV